MKMMLFRKLLPVLIIISLAVNVPTSAKKTFHKRRGKQCNLNTNILCGHKCLPLQSICDDRKDCANGHDEINCHEMEVSLKEGTRRGEGRVELKISNITGTICSDLWDDRDAKVICRMLGFGDVNKAKAVRAYNGSSAEGQQKVIWMSRVSCKGHETHINDCKSAIWGAHRCSHKMDAGVICVPETTTRIPLKTTSSPVSSSSSTSSSSSSSPSSSSSSSTSASTSRATATTTTITTTTSTNQTCGKRYIHPILHKIIGGQPSTYGSHPWMARVMIAMGNKAYHLCGGTIVGDRWVLTAAHCFVKEKNKGVIVKVGDHNFIHSDDHEQIFIVDKIFIHGSFYENPYILDDENDEYSENDNNDDYYYYDDDDSADDDDDDDYFHGSFRFFDIISNFLNNNFYRPRQAISVGAMKGDIALLRLGTEMKTKITGSSNKKTIDAPIFFSSGDSINKNKFKSMDMFKVLKGRKKVQTGKKSRRNRNKKARNNNNKHNKAINVTYTTPSSTAATTLTSSPDINATTSPKLTTTNLTKQSSLQTTSNKPSAVPNTTKPSTRSSSTSTKKQHSNNNTSKPTKLPTSTPSPEPRPFIRFNSFIQPACLPSSSSQYTPDMNCEVTGWGIVKEDSSLIPTALHSAKIPIMSDSECKKLYKDLFKYFVTEDSFCAGYATGKVDTCSGDSGGPLVCDIDGVHTLMGVTSRGNGCANKNSPGIYAKVANFADWIQEIMAKYDD